MRKGFTLIELLVVVLIIGILALVALPKYQLAVDKARLMSFIPLGKATKDALEMFYLSNGRYPTIEEGITGLDVELPGCSYLDPTFVDCGKARIDYIDGDAEGAVGVKMYENYVYQLTYQFYLDHHPSQPGHIQCCGATQRGHNVCGSLCGQNTNGYCCTIK